MRHFARILSGNTVSAAGVSFVVCGMEAKLSDEKSLFDFLSYYLPSFLGAVFTDLANK